MAKAKKSSKKVAKKAAKKVAKAPKASARGTRYSTKEKSNILLFVDKFNAKNGRGGAAEAARKFNITQLTISKWMKETGSPTPKRKSTVDFDKTVTKLTKIHAEMASLQTKLDDLRKEYVELKAAL